MGLIFYLSSRSQVSVPLSFPGFDKLLHAIEYAVLGILLIRALDKENPKGDQVILKCLAIIIAMLYGLSDEFHQGFVPGRCVDFFDWCADSFGVLLGVCILYRHTHKRESKA